MKKFLALWFFLFAGTLGIFAEQKSVPAETSATKKIVVVPVHGEINTANFYIFRRGIKQAIADGADALVLDVNTPGGELSVTFEIIDALQKFPGKTLAYVNPDAISAGAYISGATAEIYFSPNGKIGAAAVVSGSGGDIDKTMKQKINSYLIALTKTFAKADPYRADVLRAMMDADYVLKIDGEILKDKNGDPVKAAGTLLTLTADEAMQQVGSGGNARPLLGAGCYENLDTMLAEKFSGATVEKIEPTGLELVGQFMSPFVPVMLGLGLLLLFFEIKSPGFGVPGIVGIALVVAYFVFQHLAGLSGYEGLLIFCIGVILLIVEIFLLPGFFVFAIAGVLLMLVGLLWGSADIWTLPDGSLDINWEMFSTPIEQLFIALVTIIIAGVIAYKFLPARWFKNKIVLQSSVGVIESEAVGGSRERWGKLPPIGSAGTAITEFRPMGIVKIGDSQFDAAAESGTIEKGDAIIVCGFHDFELIVRKSN